MRANTSSKTCCDGQDFQIRRAEIANLPIYTPYPNSHLKEFVARYVAEKPCIEETDEYQRDPFTRDVSERENHIHS